MTQDDSQARFAASVLPHLDAAFNLARWLVRDAHDAQDVVQDALVRALRHFDGFRGGDPRPWLLAIVRNAAFASLGARRPNEVEVPDDELDAALAIGAPPSDPESLAIRRAERREIDAAIAALPIAFREAVVLEFTAPEVAMGFFAPELGLRALIVPGEVAKVPFTADKVGRFDFLCDVFCGDGHEGMNGHLTVQA